jgi:hypothetical protein
MFVEPVAKRGNVGWNATDIILLCPFRVSTKVAFDPSGVMYHNFAVLSSEKVAKRGKVEWNATEITPPRCPLRVSKHLARFPSDEKLHNFTVLSNEPVAKSFLFG